MERIDRMMATLGREDQKSVAFYVHRSYGGPLTGPERTRRWRDGNVTERVTKTSQQRDEMCDENVTESVTKTSRLSPTPPVLVLDSKASSTSKGSRSKGNYRPETLEILELLNKLAGKSFRPVAANLKFIEARLASGATVSNCKGVIARKVREWKTDPKLKKYLRPETLFNETKFEQYVGEREPEELTHGA